MRMRIAQEIKSSQANPGGFGGGTRRGDNDTNELSKQKKEENAINVRCVVVTRVLVCVYF